MRARACLLVALAVAPPAAAQSLEERARALHRDAIVVDGHNDATMWLVDYGFDFGMDGWEPDDRWAWPWFPFPWLPGRPDAEGLRTHSDLARFAAGGVDAQFFSIWPSDDYYDPENPTSGRSFARANEMIDAVEAQAARHASRMAIARSVADVRRLAGEGRLAALLGVEGGHAIDHDLEKLRALSVRGVRYMTLTWTFSHTWADASGDPLHSTTEIHGGLTEFGRAVVREMNALGVLVDVSHVSDPTFWDALETTRAPVIASHSSARGVTDHPRNLSDEMLAEVARNGGVVMINFATSYLDERKTTARRFAWDWLTTFGGSETNVGHVVDHVDRVVAAAGIDHVGVGSDYDGTPFLPTGLAHVAELPNLTVELLRRGYDEEQVRKILGENLLRVLGEAERIADADTAR